MAASLIKEELKFVRMNDLVTSEQSFADALEKSKEEEIPALI